VLFEVKKKSKVIAKSAILDLDDKMQKGDFLKN